jgi:hypothetical protein
LEGAGIVMEKYTALQQELVRSLTERLLEIDYELGKKNFFFADVEIDHHITDILVDHLSKRTAFAESVSDFLFETELKRDAFDRQVRDRVYDVLYEAHGGLS